MVNYSLNGAFGALSDITRRHMLHRLAKDEITVSKLAEAYSMSLPAVSKHLKVLEQAGLITREKRGRQYFVRLTPFALQKATEHLQYYQAVLHNRLDSFTAYMQQAPPAEQQTQVGKGQNDEEQELVFSTVVAGTPQDAWCSYTDPKCIREWWGSSKHHVIDVQNDVRVGGSWQFRWDTAQGKEYIFSGRYSVVTHPERLEYTDGTGDPYLPRPEAHVTVTFKVLPDNKTLVTKTSRAHPAIHQLNAAWLAVAETGA